MCTSWIVGGTLRYVDKNLPLSRVLIINDDSQVEYRKLVTHYSTYAVFSANKTSQPFLSPNTSMLTWSALGTVL